MKELYLAIRARLLEKMPNLYVQVYNNQFQQLEDRDVYDFPFPCVFIEIVSPAEINQLGNGVQIYDPLLIRMHIGDDFYNGDSQEENLRIFDTKRDVFKALQKFEPDGAVAFMRTSEEQDTAHTNIYHFVQEYTTNYIEQTMAEPVDGITVDPPFTIILDVDYDKQ